MRRERGFSAIHIIYAIVLIFESFAVFWMGFFEYDSIHYYGQISIPIRPIAIPIAENFYYKIDTLPFIAFNLVLIITIICMVLTLLLQKQLDDIHFKRFAILYSVGILLTVITNYFKTWIFSNFFVSDPYGGYGPLDWELYYMLGNYFSLGDIILKLIGYSLLIVAWIQFIKYPRFNKKLKRPGKMMLSFSILSVLVGIFSLIGQSVEIHNSGSFWPEYLQLPMVLEIIVYFSWGFGIFCLPLIFSIGYIIVGARIRRITHSPTHHTEEPTLENFHTPSHQTAMELQREQKSRKKAKQLEVYFCSNCGSKAPAEHKFCPFCGSAI